MFMKFDKWWEKKAPDINRALKNNHEYIKPFFENAYEWGKVYGENLERKRHLTNATHSDSEKNIQ